VVSVLFLILTTVFVATTGDSMTYVLSVAMSNNDHPSTPVRVFWGVAMGLITVFAVGLMLQAWFMRRLWQWGEKLLDRMPLVRQVYRALKELVDYLSGEEQPGGSTVVMLRYGEPSMRLLGLVTRDDVDYGPQDAEEPLVAVFLPWSYQVGGFTVYVPRSSLDKIDLTREQALRLAITAGVSAEPHKEPGKRPVHTTQDGGATPS
jgi:uncharacterized membrane protein